MHRDIVDSGLDKMLNMGPVSTDPALQHFLGKKVTIQITPKNIRTHGEVIRTAIFEIREFQTDYMGRAALRGYDITTGDTFGKCIPPSVIASV